MKNIFLLRKVFLIIKKISRFWDMFLIQVKFSCRRDKKSFSNEIIFLFWEKYSSIFLTWDHIF